ncbi:hypothetical protein jhhlp_002733 [Lomentospora prolificans]|uniref:DUF8035 domain-containing protein n=1 Tax=Lomentospora prolificans TaxID=41688 RepID=A0A2N3NEW2_9PEZI|nr:hypothetical protein jhhlp_002733 [Lomentospora prolificans]
MADYRDRDRVIYDHGPTDHVYHRSNSRFRSPSPSPDRLPRFERRPQRFHDDFTDDGRSDIDFRGRPSGGAPRGYVPDDHFPHQPRYVHHRDLSPEYQPQRVVERRSETRRFRSPSPAPLPRRPTVLRRQSSLDTFDRPRFYEREEYPPPARREDLRRDDFRATYGNSPLTSRMRAMRIDDGRSGGYRDDGYSDSHSLVSGAGLGLGYPAAGGAPAPERIREREREVVKVRRRRSRSRDSLTSRTYSRRSGSSSSSSSSRSSSPSRVTSVRSGDSYPKKGKTKIPAKLLSKRALIDLNYPFLDEGKTIIILKALNQEQIDQVLRVSDEYKKAELEISAARSSAGNIVEERLEEVRATTPIAIAPPPAAPVIVDAAPRVPVAVEQPGRELEIVNETVVRDTSPSRGSSYTTTTFPSSVTTTTDSTITAPTVYERRRRHSGPLVVRRKSRSRSRHGKDIRAEIRALEAELHERKHHRHGSRGELVGGDLVRVDRLGDGQVVMFEERVEKVEEGYRGPRIERDKKGRLSLSVPKRR